MKRTTREFTTSGGHLISIKSYLTFDEMEPILKIEDQFDKSRKIIEIALISVDSVTENPSMIARSLPLRDYTEIAKEVSSAVDGGFPPVK